MEVIEKIRISSIAYFASSFDVHECPFFPHLHELKLREHSFDYYGPAGPLAASTSELTLNCFEFPELVLKEEPGQLHAMILRGCLEVIPRIEKMWQEINTKPKLIIADIYSLYGLILARKYKIPLLALYPGFFVDPSTHDLDEKTEKMLNEPIEEELKQSAEEIEKLYSIKLKNHVDVFVQGDHNISALAKTFGEQMVSETKLTTYVGPSFMDEKIIEESTLFDVELTEENLVFVSLGVTPFFKDTVELLEVIIEALKDTDYKVLISTTSLKAKEIIEKGVPKNVIVQGPVAQMYVLGYSKLFITHFGPKGIMKGVAQRVPMIGIPGGGDQWANGEVVEKLHLGKVLKDITPEGIKQAVQEVINNDEIKKALEKHQSMIQSKKSREKFFDIVMDMMK